MRFFTKKENKKIQCTACARYCEIDFGQVGYCGVRKNEGGEMVLLSYGRILFLKKEASKMLLGTVGSNMRMNFDSNWDSSLLPYLRAKEVGRQKANQEIGKLGFRYSSLELVEYIKAQSCKEVVFQFNEPLVYIEYILEVCKLCKKEKIKTSLVTTGYFSKESLSKTLSCVDEISFYFFSTFDKFYIKHCDSQLGVIKENIDLVFKQGVSLKIICPLIPNENDSEKNIESLSKFLLGISPLIPLTFLKFIPSFRMLDKALTSKEKLEEAVAISKKVGLKNVDFIF
jgi:pyruvate formate lyase activating enzyme